jgi:hypothetical protein
MPKQPELDALGMKQQMIPREACDPDIHPCLGVEWGRHVHVGAECGNQQEGVTHCPKDD